MTAGTPSTSGGSTSKLCPPPVPGKRPLEKSPQSDEENKAKAARRNLFPTKQTHTIKDLNPYQNKYTIQARVIKKGTVRTWSNSRSEGKVFDFVLQDASGEIRVTGFNQEAERFADMLLDGKVYYLSNAKIKPIAKPEYNTVCFHTWA
jgi:replication factor A1